MTKSSNPRPDVPPQPDPPVLPDVTSDEQDADGYERQDDADRDDWYRRERPPHHE
jgi:hypothetical protein